MTLCCGTHRTEIPMRSSHLGQKCQICAVNVTIASPGAAVVPALVTPGATAALASSCSPGTPTCAMPGAAPLWALGISHGFFYCSSCFLSINALLGLFI